MAKNPRELPEKLEIDFVICDNTLNRKGWRLLVEGIDLSGFLKNPVCVVEHYTWTVPVGKWKNLRVESEKLLGTVEFDRNDDEAVKLYWKYKDGYMSAVSLHVMPIEESDAPDLLVPGQRLATVTKSELIEISLVTVPGQKNAVKLTAPDGQDYKLSFINQNNDKMDETKNTDLEDLKQQLQEQKKLNASSLIDLHKERGVLQEGEEEPLKNLAFSNYEDTKKMLEARKNSKEEKKEEKKTNSEGESLAQQVKEFVQEATSALKDSDQDKWNYLDWYKKDPDGLFAMQEKDPDRYKKLEADFHSEALKLNLGNPVEQKQ